MPLSVTRADSRDDDGEAGARARRDDELWLKAVIGVGTDDAGLRDCPCLRVSVSLTCPFAPVIPTAIPPEQRLSCPFDTRRR